MSMLLELLAEKGSVNLELYGHQVGGHLLILKFGDVVCKPLLPREHFFYQSISREMRLFTPAFHGVISVCFDRGPLGELQAVAERSTAAPVALAPGPGVGDSPLPVVKRSFETIQQSKDDPPYTSSVTAGDAYVNPWSCDFQEGVLQKLQDITVDQQRQEYVVLENLTQRFNCPCILDLKVGTRQYGDYSTEAKKQKHIKTCAMSTSSALGVRFCGLQKYIPATEQYIYRDKYHGRSLTKEGFVDELKLFFHNGKILRKELIHPLIEMLKSLREVVITQDSHRFYSSSLLIIYDGKPSATTATQVNGCEEETVVSGSEPAGLAARLRASRQMVDLRMIDFAHATHSGYLNDPVRYTGEDEGYVVGLNTIIATFEDMLRD